MAELWNGEGGRVWAREWRHMDRDMGRHHRRLMAAVAVTDGERVLDFGCGNGQTTREAAAATPTGSVLGLDLSGPMLERARQLTAEEGLTNVTFVQGDAQVYPFEPGAFDVALSRFGSMFFGDPAAAFTNVGSALRSGGRLLLLVWQPMVENEHFMTLRQTLGPGKEFPYAVPGEPGPFSLADVDYGRGVLEAAGFVDVQHNDVRDHFDGGEDVDEALSFLSQMNTSRVLLEGLDETEREQALGRLREALEEHQTPDGVLFDAATWIITARRP